MSIKSLLISKSARYALMLKQHSPEILLGAGIVTTVAGTVLIARATKNAAPHAKEMIDDIKTIEDRRRKETLKEYTAVQYKDDMIYAFQRKVKDVVKPYILPSVVFSAGIGCILWSHNIITTRNIALTSAYATLRETYEKYRKKVKEIHGEEEERNINKAVVKEMYEQSTPIGQDGEVAKRRIDGRGVSPYAVFFDESNVNFEKDNEMNLFWLKSMQQMFNDRLQAEGHVFLNEVLRELGYNHTSTGAIVGWVKDSEDGDGYIDFGIYNGDVKMNKEFLAGYENQLLLDFNVQGIIYDLIQDRDGLNAPGTGNK